MQTLFSLEKIYLETKLGMFSNEKEQLVQQNVCWVGHSKPITVINCKLKN